ncbi:MAG: hypothetical protein ACPF9D_07730 [Owenweeksia sp.]
MYPFLTSLMELAIPIVVIWLVLFLLRLRWNGVPLNFHLDNKTVLYVILLLWMMIGWLTNWDNNRQFGCLITYPTPGERFNDFLLMGISLFLIICAYFVHDRSWAFFILLAELTLWLFKLFFIKGGYATGIAGVADARVLIYDSIALVLRLLFIRALTRMLVYPRTIFLLSGIIILMKLWLFRMT